MPWLLYSGRHLSRKRLSDGLLCTPLPPFLRDHNIFIGEMLSIFSFALISKCHPIAMPTEGRAMIGQ